MRSVTIDVLRAAACLLVLARHCAAVQWFQSAPLKRIGQGLGRAGWVGVDLFFVLSGFLVSGLLFREYQQSGRVGAWRFLVRRGFKIYPAYFALLVVGLVINPDPWAHRKTVFY